MTRLRILLNSGFSGPQSGFFVADAEGWFAEEGLEIDFLPGDGAAAVVQDMADDRCDLAYGDLCALVARLGGETAGPQAIWVMFNRTPLTIAVRADGPLRVPADLAGARISGHARDAAIVAFPLLLRQAGVAMERVRIMPSPASLAEQVRRMVEEDVADGVFGFTNTIIASLGGSGLAALEGRIRFIDYADSLPSLYGNALIASRRMIETAPGALAGLLRGLARGTRAAMVDPAGAVAVVQRYAPSLNVPVETRRWIRTIAMEMAHPEVERLGLGAVDPARLAAGTAALASALGLARTPSSDEVFTDRFLPARA